MKSAEIRFSLQRPPQHRDPTMVPTITAAMINSQEHLTLTHKLRKPLVEKLHRERINSIIEQLKSLLGPHFIKQQPDSKLEKADILEMTVCILRQMQQQHMGTTDVNVGYTRGVQEVVHFLPKKEVKTKSQRKLLNHFHMLQSSSDKNLREAEFCFLSPKVQTSNTKDKSLVNIALWRP
ncbi:hypothetical protein LDENG_00238840 [Lucifuga dentata]|nr:hypothetical protein LDENG_00238840 [Lucifuga dentata]